MADGERVVFVSVGGTVKCFDYEGKELWSHSWTPFGRHHARAHEPILHDGKVILMHAPLRPAGLGHHQGGLEVAGPGKGVLDPFAGLRPEVRQAGLAGGGGARPCIRPRSLASCRGKQCDPDGTRRRAQAAGRALRAVSGRRRQRKEPVGPGDRRLPGGPECNLVGRKGSFLRGRRHHSLAVGTGKPIDSVSVTEGASITRWKEKAYETVENGKLTKTKKPITYFTNVVVGNYHYFRSFGGFFIGRVNLKSGKVEYLQVPVQVIRKAGGEEEVLWEKSLPNDMKNAKGHRATRDKRNEGSGWGHVSSAPPVVVGDLIYFPTMVGMVYVLKWKAPRLDADALVSLGDLGPAGKTWSLSGLACANGRLYARTLKELICLGRDED